MTLSLAVFLFVVQLLSFIIKGLVGFGNPLLSNPLMAMRLDNRVITPANLLLDLPTNAYIVLKNRKHFDCRTVLPVAVCIMLGVVPGTLFLKLGSPWIIKALLGMFIIGLGVEMATRSKAKTHRPNVAVRTLISIASGFMAGLFGINLLFLAYMERVAENRQQFRTNVCFVFLIENIFRTLTYLYNGMFTAFSLQITLISVPAAAIGLAIGSRIDRYIDEAQAKKAVITVFIIGGVSVLVKALLFRA